MTTITVRNIPDELYEQLRRTAQANRRSISREITACIERSVGRRTLDVGVFLAEARSARDDGRPLLTDEVISAAIEAGRL